MMMIINNMRRRGKWMGVGDAMQPTEGGNLYCVSLPLSRGGLEGGRGEGEDEGLPTEK
jgi:hypothetical protein